MGEALSLVLDHILLQLANLRQRRHLLRSLHSDCQHVQIATDAASNVGDEHGNPPEVAVAGGKIMANY